MDRLTLKRILSKSHRTAAAEVMAELSIPQYSPWFHKKSDKSFTNPTPMIELQLLYFRLLKTVLKGKKYGVMIIKPGRLMIRNT